MFSNSWVRVDLDVIRNNYRIYKNQLNKDQTVMAVVKADAYGHGDREVALTLQEEGCTNFAVSCLSEAVSIRSAGIRGQILILGYTSPKYAEQLLEYDITQSVYSEDYAKILKNTGLKPKVKVKSHVRPERQFKHLLQDREFHNQDQGHGKKNHGSADQLHIPWFHIALFKDSFQCF